MIHLRADVLGGKLRMAGVNEVQNAMINYSGLSARTSGVHAIPQFSRKPFTTLNVKPEASAVGSEGRSVTLQETEHQHLCG